MPLGFQRQDLTIIRPGLLYPAPKLKALNTPNIKLQLWLHYFSKAGYLMLEQLKHLSQMPQFCTNSTAHQFSVALKNLIGLIDRMPVIWKLTGNTEASGYEWGWSISLISGSVSQELWKSSSRGKLGLIKLGSSHMAAQILEGAVAAWKPS